MNEITDLISTKKRIRKINVIIYGSIRDIEKYFLESFCNLELLSSYFNNVCIIIFENDSKDNTRELLKKWHKEDIINVKKHIILEDQLVSKYPLRATRLAYCRNKILDYIFSNNLNENYEYAIHCDLDDRFWCVDYESVCNCFQYDSDSWDVMTCVGKNKSYYDFWALRIQNSWFNKNIFSCKAEDIDWETKIPEFTNLLKNTSHLLKTESSFNGLAIYKLNKMKNGKYDATYKCEICLNRNRGCFEDNDHIGLHKYINENGGKIFINVKMNVISKPKNAISYKEFVEKYLLNINVLNKNPLLYILNKDIINQNHTWLDIGTKIGETANIISNYTENEIFSFNLGEKKYTLLNKNVKVVNTSIEEFSNNFYPLIKDNDFISFVCFNVHEYILVKSVLNTIFIKIQNECIIVFDNFINYDKYLINSLKAFYEITQEYEIEFEIIGTNNGFLQNDYKNQNYNENFNYQTNTLVVLKIIKNPLLNKNSKTIENSFKKIQETQNENKYKGFDYEIYSMLNKDLKELTLEKSWNHLIKNGIYENRKIYFHWKKYIQDYPFIENRLSALEHLKNNKEINTSKYFVKLLFNEEENEECIKKYNLSHNSLVPEDFNWCIYLILNTDIIENDKYTKENAFKHWINHGYAEKRKYKIII